MTVAKAETPPRMLSAAGTAWRQPVSTVWRVWLAIELALLFIAMPFGVKFFMQEHRVPLFLALLPVLAAVLLILLLDRSFKLRREFSRRFGWRTALSILAIFLIGGAGVAYWVHATHPEWFLDMPTRRPKVWLTVLMLYPVGSVLAQELIYRTFYFHRYGPLFGTWIVPALLLNSVLFGLAHIVVGSAFAMVTTSITGLLFAVRYHTSQSFWAVWIEHALWGALVFTIGLNRYFFSGVPNF